MSRRSTVTADDKRRRLRRYTQVHRDTNTERQTHRLQVIVSDARDVTSLYCHTGWHATTLHTGIHSYTETLTQTDRHTGFKSSSVTADVSRCWRVTLDDMRQHYTTDTMTYKQTDIQTHRDTWFSLVTWSERISVACFAYPNLDKKLSYLLESRASAWCIDLIVMLLAGILLSEFSYTLCVEFLAKLHSSRHMLVYKNSTHSSLRCPF